jgi:hypothetical protein
MFDRCEQSGYNLATIWPTIQLIIAIKQGLILIWSLHNSYANCSAYFISAYMQGPSGAEAAWANHKYHGHHTLPPHILTEVKKAFQ